MSDNDVHPSPGTHQVDSLDSQVVRPNQNNSVSEESPKPESPRDKSKVIVSTIVYVLKNRDINSAVSLCDQLIETFKQAETDWKKAIFPEIRTAFVVLKRTIDSSLPESSADIAMITAMFKLISTMTEWDGVVLEDKFNAFYHAYWCAKKQPLILKDRELLWRVRMSIIRAGACIDELSRILAFEGQFRSRVLSWTTFWHRAGEILLAHWKYECIDESDLLRILDKAIASFRKIVAIGVGVSFANVVENRMQLAGSLHWAGNLLEDSGASAKGEQYSHEAVACFYETVHDALDLEFSSFPGDFDAALAQFYFDQDEHVRSYRCALLAAETAAKAYESYEQLINCSFNSLLRHIMRSESPEAIAFLEHLLIQESTTSIRLLILTALGRLYAKSGDTDAVTMTRFFFLRTADRISLPPIAQLTSEQKLSLLDDSLMPLYVNRLKDRLSSGDLPSLIRELSTFIAAREALPPNSPDVVLRSILAGAYDRVGDTKMAFQLLEQVLTFDRSEKNQGIAHLAIGDIHLANGAMSLAARAYEESYRHGGGKLAALFKAALAYVRATEYESALRHLNTLLQPENIQKDVAPHQTRTLLAQALWGRFCQSSPAGRNEGDVIRACRALREVLDGKLGDKYVDDEQTAYCFVDMVSCPIALSEIADFLRHTFNADQVRHFASALARKQLYPRPIIEVALERLGDLELSMSPKVKHAFLRILSRALIRAYYFDDVDGVSFEGFAHQIITAIDSLDPYERRKWLFEMVVVGRHSSRYELIHRYADEAIKLFAPVLEAPETAKIAISDPSFLHQINDFILEKIPPSTVPAHYDHWDAEDLLMLIRNLVRDSKYGLQTVLADGNSQLSVPGSGVRPTVSLIGWITLIRPFLCRLLDLSPGIGHGRMGPLAVLASESAPWSFEFSLTPTHIEAVFSFSRLEPTHNPIRILQDTESYLKQSREASGYASGIYLDFQDFESEHRLRMRIKSIEARKTPLQFRRMSGFVRFINREQVRIFQGGNVDPDFFLKAQEQFRLGYERARSAGPGLWVEFIRHVLDSTYALAADSLLFITREDERGRHPRSVVHQLKKKVEEAILVLSEGGDLSLDQLAEFRYESFRLAANILFAQRGDSHGQRGTNIELVLRRVVHEIQSKLPRVEITLSCPPSLYAYLDPRLLAPAIGNLVHNSVVAALTTDDKRVQVRAFLNETSPHLTMSVLNRYDPDRHKWNQGTGIGLEEARYFTEMISGGQLVISDDEETGTYEVQLIFSSETPAERRTGS